MPRIAKPKTAVPETESDKKKRERIDLAIRIERSGDEMAPCSFCVENRRKCVVATGEGSRCSECVRAKRKVSDCDAQVVDSRTWETEIPRAADWEAIDRQIERLDEEEEAALSKQLRLKKQKAFLRRRRQEMLRRGLKYLDELDEAEEKERLEKEEAERAALPSSSDVSVDPVGDPGLDLPSDPNDPFWATLELYGGMTPTTGGS